MKTKMKRQGSTELPRFAVGALAIAGASAANAAVVQITFNNSYVSTTGVNSLVADFGGDGVANLRSFRNGIASVALLPPATIGYQLVARATGGYLFGKFPLAYVSVGGVTAFATGGGRASVHSLVTVAFSDANIRNGATTNGWLDITAVATQPGEKRLTVNRLIFDDASATAPDGLSSASTGIAEWGAVPEPSSLGLLALGAGGLLARRRRAMAA